MIPQTIAHLLFLVKFVALFQAANSLKNGLALTPPMGWLAWERFTCETDCTKYPNDCINSRLFRTMAHKLVRDGYLNVGYKYVNIDDCWSEKERDNNTQRLVPDSQRFPEGMKNLSDYVHGLGLKLGIYGDCGTMTCAGYPAQLKTESNYQDNYFDIDANTLNDWRVDSFKFDGCYIEPHKAESVCPDMARALKSVEHSQQAPILLTCEWPFYLLRELGSPNYQLAQDSCNLWRYYEDIEDSWISILNTIDFTVNMQDTIVKYHGPGGWFDPDQLVIGNFGLSLEQAKAQMAIWAVWAAPLYMSNDLRMIDIKMASLLKNVDLIKVNQDKLGVFGLMVDQYEGHNFQAFVKPVEPIVRGCPTFAVVYLNRNTLGGARKISFNLIDILRKSAIEVAAERYSQLYNATNPNGEFDANHCRERLQKANSTGESGEIFYKMYDLVDSRPLPIVVANSNLELEVKPSGVRAVLLTEDVK